MEEKVDHVHVDEIVQMRSPRKWQLLIGTRGGISLFDGENWAPIPRITKDYVCDAYRREYFERETTDKLHTHERCCNPTRALQKVL